MHVIRDISVHFSEKLKKSSMIKEISGHSGDEQKLCSIA